MSAGRIAILLFLALFLIYASLSPGAISGMGYAGETVKAARQVTRA